MTSAVTILPPDTDVVELQTSHREEFLSRLRDAYPDPADTVRRQAERLTADWWPAATRSQEDVA